MKKILSTLAISLSALVATSAMAAPHHDSRFAQHHAKPTPPSHWNQKDAKKWHQDHRKQAQRFDDRRLNPSRDWRSGDKLPKQFENNRYRLNGHETRHLPKTAKNQSWYKVNGDYVLVNDRNSKIVRILG